MPWLEQSVEDQRIKFIAAMKLHKQSFAELCRAFGISRETGYKWRRRYEDGGPAALVDASRAPHRSPHAYDDEVVRAVLDLRRAYPRWGPKKLAVLLQRQDPEREWPVPSTIGEILKRHGLTAPRRRHRRGTVPAYINPMLGADEPNAVWSMDFKGQFRLGSGPYCYPFTVTDNFSRYLLRCTGMPDTELEPAWLVLESAFREFGLPAAIRTDNGAPFGSRSAAGMTRMSVRLVKLGIVPERIDVGRPDQNGRHERMHRTLKADTAKPPAESFEAQERRFSVWRPEYNEVRPHEALNGASPASVYRPSLRRMPERLPEVTYPDGTPVRIASRTGIIKVSGVHINVGVPFAREPLTYEFIDDDTARVWFSFMCLGDADLREVRSMNYPSTRLRPPPNHVRHRLADVDHGC